MLYFSEIAESARAKITGEWAEEKIDFILGYELHVLTYAQTDILLIIENLESQFLSRIAYLHAAGSVDFVDGELIRIALITPGIGKLPSQLDGSTEFDRSGNQPRCE